MGMQDPDPSARSDSSDDDAELHRLTKQIVDAYLIKNPVEDPTELSHLNRIVFNALSDCQDRLRRRQRRDGDDGSRDPSTPEYAW